MHIALLYVYELAVRILKGQCCKLYIAMGQVLLSFIQQIISYYMGFFCHTTVILLTLNPKDC